MKNFLRPALALLAGAAAMYYADPDRGVRRRSLLRDRFVRWGHVSSGRLVKLSRDYTHRGQGLLARLVARLYDGPVDDEILVERVRSQIGHLITRPHAVEVRAERGRVTLKGFVPAEEADALLDCAARVRGVRALDHQLRIMIWSVA
jgi:hypothetical protein